LEIYEMSKSKIPHPAPEGEPEPFAFGANVEGAPPSRDGTPADDTPPAPPSTPAPDPFDPQALRLSQDFGAAVGVKKALLTVPVRKPHNSWFVRVHPSPDYRIETPVIELKEDREIYLVAPDLRDALATEPAFKPKMLATAVNRQGVLFLWEVNLPRSDGRVDEWSRTALEAVNLATKGWVRVTANMGSGGYEVFQATGQLPGPDWPDLTLRELLRIAFKERYIDGLEHPVLRRLRGEV
jgi:hypothetical protein